MVGGRGSEVEGGWGGGGAGKKVARHSRVFYGFSPQVSKSLIWPPGRRKVRWAVCL